MTAARTRHQWLQELRRRLEGERGGRRSGRVWGDRGCAVIGEFLSPERDGGGLLVEWLAGGAGSGATLAAFLVVRDLQRQGGLVIVIDEWGEFYPPAAEGLGVKTADLIVVRPRSHGDALWAWEQSLRAPGTTVIGPLDRASSQTLRRLKLAVERGNGIGLLLRSLDRRSEPSWADLRLAVSPLPTPPSSASLSRRVQVEALYVRGGLSGARPRRRRGIAGEQDVDGGAPWQTERIERRCVVLDISDETASVCVVPPVANSALARRRSRAS